MCDVPVETGYFVFSLDTELAWGYFDSDRLRGKRFSSDGSRERKSIDLLLDVLDEFKIVGTWAVVGHLFYDRCQACDNCPVLSWEGKYQSFDQIYMTGNPLWYGADVVETILARGTQHEIAFHGYTHEPFDENTMNQEVARTEIQEWLRAAEGKGISPKTVIFPRNLVGHLIAFKKAGFICYRNPDEQPRFFRASYIGKLIKSVDHILSLSSAPVFGLNGIEPSGMVNIPSSQHFFGFNRRLELALDALNLHKLRIRRMIKGVQKAAAQKRIIHVWAHPWEFKTGKDIEKLRYLFSSVSEEVVKGSMQSVGMADLARIVLARSKDA